MPPLHGGPRPRRADPRRQEQPDAGALIDPMATRATGRRPVRRARRPEPAGDRRAARGGRTRSVQETRRRPADQPPGGLAPPAAAEGGRPRRRGAARHAAHLPAPRRGHRGRPGLPRAGLGRCRRRGSGWWPRTTPRRVANGDRLDRADPARLRGRLPASSTPSSVWTAPDRPVVAGRSHRLRRRTTSRSSSRVGRAAGSSSGRSSGVEHDWGDVTVWEPPTRLGYTWHLNRDRSDATRRRDPVRRRTATPRRGSRSSTAAGSARGRGRTVARSQPGWLGDPAAALRGGDRRLTGRRGASARAGRDRGEAHDDDPFWLDRPADGGDGLDEAAR